MQITQARVRKNAIALLKQKYKISEKLDAWLPADWNSLQGPELI